MNIRPTRTKNSVEAEIKSVNKKVTFLTVFAIVIIVSSIIGMIITFITISQIPWSDLGNLFM